MRGYACAGWALVAPWFVHPWSGGALLVFVPAALISGLINPVFIAALVALLKQHWRLFRVLRVFVLLMLPFCWITFEILRPREGYVLWTLGMLLVLFSNSWKQPTVPSDLRLT